MKRIKNVVYPTPKVPTAKPPKAHEDDETFRQRSLTFLQSRKWRAYRLAYLAQFPVCQECWDYPAKELHHTTPRRDLPPEDWMDSAHIAGLCKPCHNAQRIDKVRGKRD